MLTPRRTATVDDVLAANGLSAVEVLQRMDERLSRIEETGRTQVMQGRDLASLPRIDSATRSGPGAQESQRAGRRAGYFPGP